MPECLACGKKSTEEHLVYCSQCGRAYCEECAAEETSMAVLSAPTVRKRGKTRMIWMLNCN